MIRFRIVCNDSSIIFNLKLLFLLFLFKCPFTCVDFSLCSFEFLFFCSEREREREMHEFFFSSESGLPFFAFFSLLMKISLHSFYKGEMVTDRLSVALD